MKETNIICPNCGTKFALPEHEHICNGIAIGKDSGLGNIYLTPEKEKVTMTKTKADERLEQLRKKGVDTSKFMVLTGENNEAYIFNNSNGVPVPVMDNDPIFNAINESSYIFNRFTDSRWITAQMFQMLNSNGGYNKALTMKGIDYQFSFLRDILNRMAKMERDNDPLLKRWEMFFNQNVIYHVLDDYYNELKKYIKTLHISTCKGQPYVRIRGFKYGNNHKGDVFCEDLQKKIYNPIIKSKNKFLFYNRMSYTKLKNLFESWIHDYYIRIPNGAMSYSFKDAYKGAGAYFTCENLIKFHGCRVPNFPDVDDSLNILLEETRSHTGIFPEHYKTFAFMKDLIKANNFKPDWK